MSNYLYIVRNYRPSDFEDYVKLNIEAETLDPSGLHRSPETVSENLSRPNYSPEQDLFVAEIDGKVVGFINLTPELKTERVILDCLVHPQHRRRGLAKKLLGYVLRRAKDLGAKNARVNIREDNVIAKLVLPKLDFRFVRQYLELRLKLSDLPDAVPVIYSYRHLQPGEEDKLTRIQNRCFTGTWGYNPNTIEDIIYYTNLSHRSAEDIVLICEEDKPISYCWTEIKHEAAKGEKKGYVYMLGVDPDYRGRRIGKVALLTGLSYLKNKGARVAEITVDSKNEVACTLYRSVGFKLYAKSLWYEKAID